MYCISSMFNKWGSWTDYVSSKFYEKKTTSRSVYSLENEIIEKIKWHLHKFEFSIADEIFRKENLMRLNKTEYINLKRKSYIEYINQLLINWKFKEIKKSISDQWIICISEEEYQNIEELYMKKTYLDKINELLHKCEYLDADNYYSKNAKSLWNEYTLIKKKVIENHITWFFANFDFSWSDNLYENHWSIVCIIEVEYKKMKSEKFIEYLIKFLEQFNFKEADEIYNNQGIPCLEIKEYNTIKKEYIKKYFNDTQCQKLNDEKYEILADMSQYTLVKARAWTGKTTLLKYKIKLLIEKYWVQSDEILAFAFNKRAAKELMKRTQDVGVNDFCSSMTFHSFAWRVLSRTTNERYELLFDDNLNNHDQDQTLSQFTQEIIKEYIEDNWNDHKDKLYRFFRKDANQLWEILYFENNNDIYNYHRSNEYSQVCLNGVRVKSIAEKRISDFLFEHDIDFRYEHPVTSKLLIDWNWIRRQLRADFTLTRLSPERVNNNQIIQQDNHHQNENPFWIIQAPRFQDRKVLIEFRWRPGEQAYAKNMARKKQYYSQNRRYLIDFSITEINYHSLNRRENFEEIIRQKFESHWITCKKLPDQELFRRCKIKFIKDFTKKIKSFIQKAKQNKLYPESIKTEFETNRPSFNEKQVIFYEYAIEIYSRYQQKLKSTDPISKDFNDLLFESWRILANLWNSNQDVSFKIWEHPITNQSVFQDVKNLKYILVDEYQDFSLLFYSLLEWIRSINPNVKIINVGDDRQLINTFAWSKITYISEYEKYFLNWKICTLLETNRCPKKIIWLSNNFMIWYGEWAISKIWNIDWEVIWITPIEMNPQETRIQNENWNNENIVYVTTTEDAKFYGKHYEQFDKREIEINNERVEVILVPKKNSEYAQLIKTLHKICIDEQIYSSSFDLETHACKDNKSDIMILHRSNTLFHGIDHWIIWEDKFSINDIADHLVSILYEKIIWHINIQDKNIKWIIRKNLESIISSKSIHQSKWWEAKIIVILWIWQEWLYPMVHPDNELNAIFWETIQDVLDEERRLFYVALTRTKNKLYYISEKEIPSRTDHGSFLIESWSS